MHHAPMSLLLCSSLLLGACSKKADECQRVIDKSLTVLDEISRLRGTELDSDDRKALVAQCRKGLAAGKRDPSVDCVLAAADDKGVRDCYMQGFESRVERARASEAVLQLQKLGEAAKLAFAKASTYPVGKIGPTPATACCQQPDQRCAPAASDWAAPVWQALGFEITEPSRFQYSYAGDGKTFTITAVGDLACDGKPTTLTATGHVAAGGAPQVSLP